MGRRALGTVVLTGLALAAASSSDLVYQDRSGHFEGVKPKPVAGYDLELVSVLVDHRIPGDSLPEEAHASFYLPSPEPHLTVREIDYRQFYWLDQVEQSWTVGSWNHFSWQTKDVLGRLPPLGLRDLGALVRLGDSDPGLLERVTPVLLHTGKPPGRVAGYRFVLRPSADAEIWGSVERESAGAPLMEWPELRAIGGRPFTLRWRSGEEPAGAVAVQVTGYFLNSGRKFSKRIEFYHQPAVEPIP